MQIRQKDGYDLFGKITTFFRYIIFDLSEVLIAGLVGVEEDLSKEVPTNKELILPCFAIESRDELFRGFISEDEYLLEVIECNRWSIALDKLKGIIRNNFHNHVDGMISLIHPLSPKYKLVLLSDHAREWVSYIKTIHPFIKNFQKLFFSCDLQ